MPQAHGFRYAGWVVTLWNPSVAPKSLGLACYYLIVSSIVLTITALIASQGFEWLHFSNDNALAFDTQIGLSLLNSFITFSTAFAMLNGRIIGRHIWHGWAIIYLVINLWQLETRYFIAPQAVTLLVMTTLLYAKPAQRFFDEKRKRARKKGRRVDANFNIFDD